MKTELLKLACGLALLGAVITASAQTSVVSGLAGSDSSITNVNASATFGYSFTLGSSAASVTQLGLWDDGGDGFDQSHEVGLWSSTGTLLASVTIPSGTAATFANGFRYEDITPISLTAGTTYVLGVYDAAGNTDTITFLQTATPGDDIASIGYPLLFNGSSLTFPSIQITGVPDGFFGPNATLAVVSAPEPSTLALAGIGGVSALVMFRRRK